MEETSCLKESSSATSRNAVQKKKKNLTTTETSIQNLCSRRRRRVRMDLRLVQINLNHYKRALDMLEVFTREEGISVAFVSDPYSTCHNAWCYDSSGVAAIAILRNGVSIADIEVEDGYVLATVGATLHLYSCSCPQLGLEGSSRMARRMQLCIAEPMLTSSLWVTSTSIPWCKKTSARTKGGNVCARFPLPWGWP